MSYIDNLRLVSEKSPLEGMWIPDDLVFDPVARVWLCKNVYEAFYAMNHALQKEGKSALRIVAGYRSYAMQKRLCKSTQFLLRSELVETEVEACDVCDAFCSAGASEHQLGTVIDVIPSQYDGLIKNQEDLVASHFNLAWLEDYARNFGFILTDKTHKLWHYRYIGRGHAKKMARLGVDLDTYTASFLKTYEF